MNEGRWREHRSGLGALGSVSTVLTDLYDLVQVTFAFRACLTLSVVNLSRPVAGSCLKPYLVRVSEAASAQWERVL